MKSNDANVKRFDEKAKSWDEEPRRVAMGMAIARAVEAKLGGSARPRLMDYGCGTGLCSLPLAGRCASLLGVDSSTEMLARLETKARAAGLRHVTTRRHDLTAEAMAGVEVDVILCAMALHHIREIGLLLGRFRSMLAAGGLLALADLDKEDGTFHEDRRGVEHHGFDREWVRQKLQEAGFVAVTLETAYEIEKPGRMGDVRRFPVFLASARKGSGVRRDGEGPDQREHEEHDKQ
ncbi:MAG TPA: class I SAM-dependent methyltransferase [Verrucomicrobiae bacterium]|nr:class I SAM-dependent methyltransferase [Verrucomicrobiae bacterium]